jgi:Ion channel
MALTSEQQQALDALMAQVLAPVRAQAQVPPAVRPEAQVPPPAASGPDFLQTWLGISREDAGQWLGALVAQKDDLEQRLVRWTERNPLDATFEFLAAATVAFYTAEKDANPKIVTLIDAFYYLATCASVGYADIFAVTQTGRAIASLVMLLGPALTGKALNHPTAK